MDRYDRIMHDILAKTASNDLRWSVVGSANFPSIVPTLDGVRRIVMADYPLGETTFRLCFVESRRKRIGDFGAVSEMSAFEIYVFNDAQETALILDDRLVERDDLLRLAGLIDDLNDQAREFFEAFDRSGAA